MRRSLDEEHWTVYMIEKGIDGAPDKNIPVTLLVNKSPFKPQID
jgi:hypothetical protein